MTVTLIGMPGAGKSCMGRAITKKLGMKFLDGDKLIENVTGKKLQQIIDDDGLEAFKKTEEDVLLSIKEDNLVIAPGGSAIYYESVMKSFKEKGIVVYLYVSPQTIIKRLGDFSQRGIALKEGQTIFELYNERAPLLEKYADITVNCDGNNYQYYQKEVIEKIREKIK